MAERGSGISTSRSLLQRRPTTTHTTTDCPDSPCTSLKSFQKKKNENKKEHRRNINASRDLLQITHATPPKPSEPTSSHRTPPRLCLLLSGTALAPLGQAPDAWPQTCSPFRIRRRLGAIYRSCGCYRSGMSPWTLDHSVKGAAGVCSGIWL